MRKVAKSVALVGAVALLAAGCASKSDNGGSSDTTSTSSSSAAGSKIKACMVLDTGGVDDKSFNQSSWEGLEAAAKANPAIDPSFVPSDSQDQYTPNLTTETNSGCDTTIAVGGLMADAVKAIATANPSKHYAEIDSASSAPNVYGLEFNTAQGGFLGGYLAAALSKTGKVGTWGGLNIPPVTIYMDGFWEGVQYFNKQKSKNVQVLGWDETKQKAGTFAQSFTDSNKGKQLTEAMIQQGADIIFPVAGGSGAGALAAAAASNGKANVIWVDTDGVESNPDSAQYIITSVTKGLSQSVQDYMKQVGTGTYPTGNYVGTLQNGGTGLAPYHDWDSKVPADVKADLETITKGIEDGSIKITSPSQPQ